MTRCLIMIAEDIQMMRQKIVHLGAAIAASIFASLKQCPTCFSALIKDGRGNWYCVSCDSNKEA